jgi:ferredoxin
MKIEINKDKCLGCGMCVGICPDVFDFDDDGLATANSDNINDENKESTEEAVNSCPVGAIEKEED